MRQRAAERREICSPRRKPWESAATDSISRGSGGTERPNVSPPPGLVAYFDSVSHGLRHGLQIFRRFAAIHNPRPIRFADPESRR
jgi:hypothetical protein